MSDLKKIQNILYLNDIYIQYSINYNVSTYALDIYRKFNSR